MRPAAYDALDLLVDMLRLASEFLYNFVAFGSY
jgi:hypothetical protein